MTEKTYTLDVIVANFKETFLSELSHIREVINLKDKASADALEIARSELARRLEILNHEGQRISKIHELQVDKQEFTGAVNALNLRVDGLRTDMDKWEIWKARQEGKADRSQIWSILGLVFAGMSTIVTIWRLATGH